MKPVKGLYKLLMLRLDGACIQSSQSMHNLSQLNKDCVHFNP